MTYGKLAENQCYCGGGAAEIVVVEYLESTMSRNLLGKFPDNSAFDFDYAQSSIWSPLLSRNFNHHDGTSSNAGGTTTGTCGLQFLMGMGIFSSSNDSSIQRKLTFDDEIGHNNIIIIFKNLRDKIKKKVCTTATALNNIHIKRNASVIMKKKKKTNQSKSYDLSPFKSGSGSSSYTPTTKGWVKVLKAASKQFKKKPSNRKDYYHLHLHLTN